MHPHYSGRDRRRNRIDAFLNQPITFTNLEIDKVDSATIAAAFADKAEFDECKEAEQLFSATKRSYKVFFVITGKVDLLIKKRRIYRAKAGDVLGEFPVLDGRLPNVVTAIVCEAGDIASVSYDQFRLIAEKYPIVWRKSGKGPGPTAQRKERTR